MLMAKLRQYIRLEPIFLGVFVVSMVLLFSQLLKYDDGTIIDTLAKAQAVVLPSKLILGVGSGSFVEGDELPWTGKILLPAGYAFDESTIRSHLEGTKSADWPILQIPEKDIVVGPVLQLSAFANHESIPLFHSGKEAGEDNCDEELFLEMDKLKVDERVTIPGNFEHILKILIEELDEYKDPYYEETSPLFLTHLRTQLKTGMTNHFWFRLSGSSVWLKDHSVHLVISRFLFSASRSRDGPKASFVLAQVFDKEWRELKDVRLVFPTNNLGEGSPTFKVEEQDFYSYRFPRILPVPFHHDKGKTGNRYYGPEDPRVVIVKNKNGYEEPVVIINAKHHKIVKEDNEDKDKEFRSIFTCFPFQIKRGKEHVNAKLEKATDNIVYTNIVEMNILHRKKLGTSKNWSPFVSENLRVVDGHDKYLYFATQLENLEILQCDITDGLGECECVYKNDGGIGPMRGGSPLLNVNTLLKEQTKFPLSMLLPPGREVFIAFARAHLNNCGCGSKFYRPNLMVLTKDQSTYMTTGEDGTITEATKTFFKVSHISGFFSLHVPIDPWYLDRPYGMCEGVNAVIPNGISAWNIDSLEVSEGRWKADDKLTLAFSVSDFSVDRINLQGILDALLNVDDGTLFLQPPVADPSQQTIQSFISQPMVDNFGHLIAGDVGFNGRNVKCAIEKCYGFCARFGEEAEALADEHKNKDNSEAKKEFNRKLKEFEEALREEERKQKQNEEN